MQTNNFKKRTLSVLLASTLVFTLLPASALATQSSSSSSSTQTTQQTDKKDTANTPKDNKQDDKKNDKEIKKIEDDDLNTQVKNETKKDETKDHKVKEVDKSKFADPNYIQKGVDALFGAIAFNADPASCVSMYFGGAMQRGLFALGESLLNAVGTAFFGGNFGGATVTPNQVAFLLTTLDAKAKVAAEESKDLVNLIQTEAKGSVLDDFNAHVSLARGYMLTLSGDYNKIACCKDDALQDSLIAKMNIEREQTLKKILDEKAIIDNYILGTNTLSGKNIFQIFDSFADAKYGLSADCLDIKKNYHVQIQTFMADLSKYVTIVGFDKRYNAPLEGQLRYLKGNDDRVTKILLVNGADKIKQSFHFNNVGKDVTFATPFADGKFKLTGNTAPLNPRRTKVIGDITSLWSKNLPLYNVDLQGFNDDRGGYFSRYFSKGRDIVTPLGFKYYVEFLTNADKNYLSGDSFSHQFINEKEFKEALAKKPANMKASKWIERAADLKEGTCPRYIILGENLSTETVVQSHSTHACHTFKYPIYDVEAQSFDTFVLEIIEDGRDKEWVVTGKLDSGKDMATDLKEWKVEELARGITLPQVFFRQSRLLSKVDVPMVKKSDSEKKDDGQKTDKNNDGEKK